MGEILQYSDVFSDNDKTEVELKLKTEGSTSEDMKRTLSFLAKSSHRFYLDVAEKINNTL